MNSLAIIAYLKDEAHILNEWISHHLNFGASHFYLVDNGSSDSYRDVLGRYEQDTSVLNGVGLTQIQAYGKAYSLAQGKYDWVVFLDLDEFLYIKNYDGNIPKFLESTESDIKALSVYWTMFLPSELRQPKSVIQGNLMACLSDNVASCPYKTIFRSSIGVDAISYHRPQGLKSEELKIFRPEDELLQINHYRFQSYEYLLGIKAQRGGGVHPRKYEVSEIFNLMKKYLRVSSYRNSDLMELSKELMVELNAIPQVRPKVDIYNSACWKDVAESRADTKMGLTPSDLFREVFSLLNKRI